MWDCISARSGVPDEMHLEHGSVTLCSVHQNAVHLKNISPSYCHTVFSFHFSRLLYGNISVTPSSHSFVLFYPLATLLQQVLYNRPLQYRTNKAITKFCMAIYRSRRNVSFISRTRVRGQGHRIKV